MSRSQCRSRGFLYIALILAVTVLLPQVAAYGATPPEFTRLLTVPISDIPGRIAADPAGNLYVADIYHNVVKMYSPKGAFRGSFRLAYKPVSIAVSPDNYIYVGEKKFESSGRMEVFSLDGQKVRAMDVKTPVSMAFLSNGEFYALNGYFVKRYDANMNVLSQFGGYGTTDGTLIDPSSIAVNEAQGEIYVLDKGAIATENGYTDTNVWRVQVFEMATGRYLRKFSSYGYGVAGKVGSASSMAVDGQGRVYISDNVQGIVMVFDENGGYLNVLFDSAQPISNPVNLHYKNDRLYIVSTFGNYAAVFGVDGYAELRVEPQSIGMTYQQGMAAPVQEIGINNDGRGPLAWQASADASWIVLSPGSGEVAGGAGQALSVTIDPSGLTEGIYTGNISITSNGGTEKISVSLEVVAPAVLAVTPAEFTIQKKTGETITPLDVTITITNDRSGGLIWQAVSDASWLGMSPKTGMGSAASQVTITQDAAGKYTGTITVVAEGAAGSPATVTVNLEVISSGKINVVTNTPDASYTITGPGGVSYSGSGTSYTVSDVPEGDYTITYNAVQGYKTPASMTQNVVPGSEITFSGQYTDMRRQMNIIASRSLGAAGLRQNPSDVAVYRADGSMVLNFRPFETSAGAATATGDIDGDGSADIIVGGYAGQAQRNLPAGVKGFRKDATELTGTGFTVSDSKFGVTVAAGDLDGDGRAEIVTGDSKTTTTVRVYSYDGSMVYDTGLSFAAYPSGSGVEVVAADVDGDGIAELITAPEKTEAVAEVKIYRVKTAGTWAVEPIGSIAACGSITTAAVAAGDLDGDGIAEIITSCATETGSVVNAYRATGELLRSFDAGAIKTGSLAAGDTDMDGAAEIIVGEGASGRSSTVRVYSAEGVLRTSFAAFADSFGVRVSVGNLGY